MHVIILAAGQSRRFKDAGYTIPKPYLKVEWRGVIAHMIEHVINTIPLQHQIICALPTESDVGAEGIRIISTKGPADTAHQVMRQIEPDDVMFIDCDVLNETNDLLKLSKLSHCAVLVKRSENPAYSYVDNLGRFNRIEEKHRISEYAVQGAYFVPVGAAPEFMEQLEKTVAEEREPFLSHVFNRLTLEKYAVHTTYTPVDWGTPNDLKLSGARICM